jgi:hypothetical protein
MVEEHFVCPHMAEQMDGFGDRRSLLIENQSLVHAKIAGTDSLRLYV